MGGECSGPPLNLEIDLWWSVLQVMIIGPPDTLYEGGFFKCHLYFPTEYPLRPPVLKWVSPATAPASICSSGVYWSLYVAYSYWGRVRVDNLVLTLPCPVLRFLTDIWHPNIEKDGKVCISILHEPGDDRFGYEKASGIIGASEK